MTPTAQPAYPSGAEPEKVSKKLKTISELPLRLGDAGSIVRDLQRLLRLAGFSEVGAEGIFDEETDATLREFQARRRLVEDGICARQTWAALIDAGFQLGDRLLYLRSPMTRGDDVANLQLRLGRLGFDTVWVDGIFGPATERAVRDFQHNQGLSIDGSVGRATVAALQRLSGKQFGDKTIGEVRQAGLLNQQVGLEGRRILLGETGGLPVVTTSLARLLQPAGAKVLNLHYPDLSSHARIANHWEGEAYLGISLASNNFCVGYFQTEGFTSSGGRALAQHCSEGLSARLVAHPPAGLSLPILRETRMPAVWCRIGPAPQVVEQAEAVAGILRDALASWCENPSQVWA